MRITTTTPAVASNSKAKKKTSSSSGAFGDLLVEDTATEPVKQAATIESINPLLALQEVQDEPEVSRRKSMQRANLLLEQLENLRDGLLMGGISPHKINDLQDLVQQKRKETSDPKLTRILDEIEVRAAVEVAKLERQLQTA